MQHQDQHSHHGQSLSSEHGPALHKPDVAVLNLPGSVLGGWETSIIIGKSDRETEATVLEPAPCPPSSNAWARNSVRNLPALCSPVAGWPPHHRSGGDKVFAGHTAVTARPRGPFVFAQPDHSGRRGLSGRTNGCGRKGREVAGPSMACGPSPTSITRACTKHVGLAEPSGDDYAHD